MLIFFFEVGSCAMVRGGFLHRDLPSYSLNQIFSEFWVINNPYFGRWHGPNSSYHHRRTCFDVKYHANSFGMRDKPRNRISSRSRTILLGDSFVEGYGLADGKRISNLLEAQRNREHLNFGTSGYFGPTEYYLLYKKLAKKFSHDEVLVGIFPGNDFNDDNYQYWKGTKRYQPFLTGHYPNYTVVYTGSGTANSKPSFYKFLKGFFREFTHTYGALGGLIKLSKTYTQNKKNTPDGKNYSGFYDFSEEEYQRMKFAIEGIKEEAKDKKLAVFLIPSPQDFERYKSDGTSPLGKKLKKFGEKSNIQIINLLPLLYKRSREWEQYYNLPCDHHFGDYGSQVVASIIQNEIE